MNKDFLNPNNIKLIYDTLYDLNFNNIQYIVREKNENKLNELKNFIMENIETYNKDNNKEKKTLIETNKNFMMFLYNDIEINEKSITTLRKYKKNKPTIMNTLTNNIYETRNHIEEKNKQEFTNKLKNKQKEFENEINIIIPPTPNFKDETFEKPLKNIDLNQLILERKNEIEKIIQNEYKQDLTKSHEAQDFLYFVDERSMDATLFSNEGENKQKIKISTTDINILEDIETFDETSNSFLKKFKLTNYNNNNNNNLNVDVDVDVDENLKHVSWIDETSNSLLKKINVDFDNMDFNNNNFNNDKFDNITYKITDFKETKIKEYQEQLDYYLDKKIKEYQEQLNFYFDKKIQEFQIKINMKNEYLANQVSEEGEESEEALNFKVL